MTLSTGARLGPYEVLSALGAGGMGEVYRARDTKLNRDVALKVLPEAFALDLDRLARFKREAQVLASLNHPNVAAIYGFEESDGVQALVLELVEGPTLADRLEQGSIPIDDALPVARQIAEALEAAHARGIVHRDLKPANLKLRHDGAVKVLDFGLAKALATDSSDVTPTDPSLSPTITTPAATRMGVIMGTAAYMSPEQARGQTAGDQADIWAFGVVLYEMLTGKAAFPGETITDVLGGIVKVDPDWTALPENTPSLVRLLLRQCLQRNRTARLHHIGDARIAIDAALSDRSLLKTTDPPRIAARRQSLAWIAAVVLVLAGAGAALVIEGYVRPKPRDIGSVRFSVAPPIKSSFSGGPNAPYVSISPDGRHLAFIANLDGVARIWVRSLDTLEARPLKGSEGVVYYPPFWSPDSRSIGFFSAGKLKKIEIAGGPAQTLCDGPTTNNPSGTWNRDGVIVFGGGNGSLRRVSAVGGSSEAVTSLDQSRREEGHDWPTFLPDGDHFFFLARSSMAENNAIFIGSLRSKKPELVINALSRIAYDPAGYLLFVREQSLMALPFDARKLVPGGDPLVVAEQVRTNASGQASVTVSENGVLAYRTAYVERNTLTWFDRSGKSLGTLGPTGGYQNPELSPDEKRVAIERTDPQSQSQDVWVIEVGRGVMTRLTFGLGFPKAVWSPNGDQIAFQSGDNAAVYIKQSSGAGSQDLLFQAPGLIEDWSSDGKSMIGSQRQTSSIWIVPLSGSRKPVSYLPGSRFVVSQPQLSSDLRWMAYRSNESGRNQIYVQSFPTPSVKWQISTDGGDAPRWRRDGKEIFYLAPDQKLMAVSLTASAKGVEISRPASLFEITVGSGARHQYDVTGDGQRFLVNAITDESEAAVTVVLNWTAGLKK